MKRWASQLRSFSRFQNGADGRLAAPTRAQRPDGVKRDKTAEMVIGEYGVPVRHLGATMNGHPAL